MNRRDFLARVGALVVAPMAVACGTVHPKVTALGGSPEFVRQRAVPGNVWLRGPDEYFVCTEVRGGQSFWSRIPRWQAEGMVGHREI